MEIENEIARLIYKYEGNDSPAYRQELNKLQEETKLPPTELDAIVSKLRERHNQGKLRHQKYEKAFLQKYNEGTHNLRKTRQELQQLQKHTRLSNQDIDSIETIVQERLDQQRVSQEQERQRQRQQEQEQQREQERQQEQEREQERQRERQRDKRQKIGLIIFGCGLFLLSLFFALPVLFSKSENELELFDLCSHIESNKSSKQAERRSLGERNFTPNTNNDFKENAQKAFNRCDPTLAAKELKKSLQKNKNDPEGLIYLNNAKAANQPSFKIVVSVPIESNPDIAKEILRGVAQAQNEVNEDGGIYGKKLVVEIASDDNNPDIVTQLVPEFVEDKSILAVVGHHASKASLAGAPIYEGGKLVMISPTSTNPVLSTFTDYVFRTVYSDSKEVEKLRDFIYESEESEEVENLAICANTDPYPGKFKEVFQRAVQNKDQDWYDKLISDDCDLDALWDLKDESEQLKKAREIVDKLEEKGAKALLLIPTSTKHNGALAIAKANESGLRLFASSTLYIGNTLQEGGENVVGMKLPTPWHPDSDADGKFSGNAEELWGAEVTTWRTALAYDAVIAIVEALESLRDSTPPTREDLQKEFSSDRFSARGASSPFRFDENGDTEGDVYFVEINDNNRFELIE